MIRRLAALALTAAAVTSVATAAPAQAKPNAPCAASNRYTTATTYGASGFTGSVEIIAETYPHGKLGHSKKTTTYLDAALLGAKSTNSKAHKLSGTVYLQTWHSRPRDGHRFTITVYPRSLENTGSARLVTTGRVGSSVRAVLVTGGHTYTSPWTPIGYCA